MRFRVFSIFSFSVIILLLFSCGRKSEPLEVAADTFSQVEVPNAIAGATQSETSKVVHDENYKAALRAQMSGMKKMEKVVQSGGIDEEAMLLNWMQGTWEWSGRICVDGSNYANVSSRLIVKGEMITLYGDEGVLDKGTIKDYDLESGTLTFGDGTRMGFDNERKIVYFDRKSGEVYKKKQPSSYNNTPRESLSDSKSTQYSPLRARYDKLNEEATKIVEDFEKSLRAGGIAYCMLLANQLRDINDEKISIARQLGDPELLRVSIYQKNQSEAAMRQLGL